MARCAAQVWLCYVCCAQQPQVVHTHDRLLLAALNNIAGHCQAATLRKACSAARV